MIAFLSVKLEPAGEFVLKEAGDGMTFNQTIGPISDACDFYRKIADRIAQLAHDGKLVKYVDLEEERPHTSQDLRTR